MRDLAFQILAARKTCLFFLGQAGFIIKSNAGTILGIDLYLTQCVERLEGHMGYKRLLPIVLGPEELIFDGLVATHPHYDHFDVDAIPILMASHRTKLFASVNCAAEIKRLQMSDNNVCYVKPGDHSALNDILLEFVRCDHGIAAPDAVGLIITVDGCRIYIAGDTCLHLEQVPSIGKIDIMIAPINGAYGNLNEKECMELSKALRPALTIPCHYGMFASHGGNPGLFLKYMTTENLNCYLMRIGECLDISLASKI